jgi:hypothetical protein
MWDTNERSIVRVCVCVLATTTIINKLINPFMHVMSEKKKKKDESLIPAFFMPP